MNSELDEKITKYHQTLHQSPHLEKCPRCISNAPTFKRHDCRTRQLLYCIGAFIKTMTITLLNWKCSICHKTFTFYPQFMAPYKHYLLPEIIRLSHNFLEQDPLIYRETVQQGRSQIAYDSESEKTLSHASVWYWVTYLGQFIDTTYRAIHLIVEKESNCKLHREANPISPKKYRSEQRRQTLLKVAKAVKTNKHFIRLFFNPIFPGVLNSG